LEIAALRSAETLEPETPQIEQSATRLPLQNQPAQPKVTPEVAPPEAAPEPRPQIEAEIAAVSVPDEPAYEAQRTEGRYKPSFDLVRVEPDGSAVIAGKAPAGAVVSILSNGIALGQTKASPRGEFVAFVSTVPQQDVQTLELSAETTAKTRAKGLALPETEAAPTVIKATPDGLTIVQAPDLAELDHVTLDTIGYDTEGEVVLTGRGVPGQRVFVYADDKPVGANRISERGSWRMVMVGLTAGRYVLRVDEVDEDGAVSSRVESPFQRVYPEDELLAKGLTRKNGIVQPGSNLWTIARVRYGNGTKFTQIFDANRDRIRDPNLIYPGQIFNLPEEQKSRTGPVKRKQRG